MTTPITKERLTPVIERLEHYASKVKWTDVKAALDMLIAADVMRQALAAMDAEPVAISDDMAYAFHHAQSDSSLGADEVEEIKAGLRAALANVTTPPAPVVNAEPVADVVAWHKEGEERTCDIRWRRFDVAPGPLFTVAQQVANVPTFDEWLEIRGNKPLGWVKDAMRESYDACRSAMLQAGNSPVIPDGWQLVPKRLTAENGAKGALSGEFSETKFINCPECFGDEDCETCDGSGRIEISVPVSWTTIKAIWAKGVEHFSEAPQQEGM